VAAVRLFVSILVLFRIQMYKKLTKLINNKHMIQENYETHSILRYTIQTKPEGNKNKL